MWRLVAVYLSIVAFYWCTKYNKENSWICKRFSQTRFLELKFICWHRSSGKKATNPNVKDVKKGRPLKSIYCYIVAKCSRFDLKFNFGFKALAEMAWCCSIRKQQVCAIDCTFINRNNFVFGVLFFASRFIVKWASLCALEVAEIKTQNTHSHKFNADIYTRIR